MSLTKSNDTQTYTGSDGNRKEAVGVVLMENQAGGDGAALPAGTDRSGSITTGGTAQQLAPANTARKSLTIQNISDIDLWINEIGGTALADGVGSYKVIAGQAFIVATNRAISIVGATTGKKWTATET